jgi:Mg2+ and Co2+ transporter CorA|tara:strand:+ start:174 stop:356 length:183 start_codon:yes stop_codon:yes gene_type:complete
MKLALPILIVCSIFLFVFNLFQINFKELNDDQNTIAFIGIFASVCAVLILLIFKASKKFF